MGVQLRDAANALRAIPAMKMRDSGGTLRAVNTGKVRDAGNVLRSFFTSLLVDISPTPIEKTEGSFSASKTITTGVATANVAGGTAPFTYAWTILYGTMTVITVLSTTAQSTAFRATLSADETTTGVATCTVTDANGATASSAVDVTITHVGYA